MADSADVYTEISQIRSLPRATASEHHPVHIRGVVTYFRPGTSVKESGDLVVQDQTTGILVGMDRIADRSFESGQVLDVIGVTEGGHSSRRVAASSITVIGKQSLPKAKPARPWEIAAGIPSEELVELRGVVHAARENQPNAQKRLILDVVSEGERIPVWVLHYHTEDLTRFTDRHVNVCGVCNCFASDRGQPYGVRLMVEDVRSVVDESITAPSEPFQLPLADPDNLLPATATSGHNAVDAANLQNGSDRVRVRGCAVWQEPGERIYLISRTLGVRVYSSQREPVLRSGDEIEVVGFPAIGPFNSVIEDAIYRVVGRSASPHSIEATPASLREGDYDAKLITIQGTLQSYFATGSQLLLRLRCGDEPIDASMPRSRTGSLDLPRLGSLLRITGVCEVQKSPPERFRGVAGKEFQILLRSAEDIAVLRPGPWWTYERSQQALVFCVAILGVALAWVWTLRRQVRERSQQLAREIREREGAAAKFEGITQERHRLAAELHDNVEQGLTGAALHLEAVKANLKERPAVAERHLASVDKLLARSRAEAHRSVWELHVETVGTFDLAGAIEDACREMAGAAGLAFHLSTEGDPRGLDPVLERNLLRIAQEATANAVKHAAASRLEITLHYSANHICLKICDDGAGFKQDAAMNGRNGHFGLAGMRDRALRVNGEFQILSEPGSGTIILVTVPLQHDSHPNSSRR